jgi:hypothetical protein
VSLVRAHCPVHGWTKVRPPTTSDSELRHTCGRICSPPAETPIGLDILQERGAPLPAPAPPPPPEVVHRPRAASYTRDSAPVVTRPADHVAVGPSMALPAGREAQAWLRTTREMLARLDQEIEDLRATAAQTRLRLSQSEATAEQLRRILAQTGATVESPDGDGAQDPHEEPVLARKLLKGGAWARDYPNGCIDCGRTTVKHVGHGRCANCQRIFKLNEARANVAADSRPVVNLDGADAPAREPHPVDLDRVRQVPVALNAPERRPTLRPPR